MKPKIRDTNATAVTKSTHTMPSTSLNEQTITKESHRDGNVLDAFSLPADPLQPLLTQELDRCAKRLELTIDALWAWFDGGDFGSTKNLIQLLRTANRYLLDPLQEEIFLTRYDNQWQLGISVDGWIQLLHRHPAFRGISFSESAESTPSGQPQWIECSIYRCDQNTPTTIREHFSEVESDSELWKKMPRRMLRHRALQQCARVAIGVGLAEGFLANHGGPTKCDDIPIPKPECAISTPRNHTEMLKQRLTQKAPMATVT